MEGSLYFCEKNSSTFMIYRDKKNKMNELTRKEDGVQFRILQLHSHWFGTICSITRHKFKSYAFFKLVVRNMERYIVTKFQKLWKLWNEILLQYYHEQVISVVDRAKMFSDAEPIIKLASSSSEGERIFRDLRSEIYLEDWWLL